MGPVLHSTRTSARLVVCALALLALIGAVLPAAAGVGDPPVGLDTREVVSAAPRVASDAELVTGDVDGDGDTDLVTGSDAGLLTLWRQEAGAWTAEVVMRTPDEDIRPLAMADLDGDGDAEIVVRYRLHTRIMFQGPTGGTGVWLPFDPELRREEDFSSPRIDLASPIDADADGDIDLIVGVGGLNEPGAVRLLTNDGTGRAFATTIVDSDEDVPDLLLVGDLDGDGDDDVVSHVDEFQRSSTAAYRNDGPAGWVRIDLPQPSFEDTPNNAQSVALSDPDGDGTSDVLIVEPDEDFGDGRPLVRYRADAALASFTRTVVLDAGDLLGTVHTMPDGVLSVGFDGRKLLRPAGADAWVSTVAAQSGTQAAVSTPEGDLVVVLGGAMSLMQRPADPSGPWPEAPITGIQAADPSVVVQGDIDGDGVQDLVAGSGRADVLTWHRRDAGGWQTTGISNNVSEESDNTFTRIPIGVAFIQTGDVDGDGDTDVVTASRFRTEVVVFVNLDGAGTQWERRLVDVRDPDEIPDGAIEFIIGFSDTAAGLVVEDLDDDGDVDIAVAAQTAIKLFRNPGDGATWQEEIVAEVSRDDISETQHGYTTFNGLDADGDGDTDLVTVLNGTLHAYANDGSGGGWVRSDLATVAQVETTDYVDIHAETAKVRDVDADGIADLLLLGMADPLSWARNPGGSGPWPVSTLPVDGRPADADVADVDGDGDLDVVQGDGGQLLLTQTTAAGPVRSAALLDVRDIRGVAAIDVDGVAPTEIVTASALDGRISISRPVTRATTPSAAAISISRSRFRDGTAPWVVLARDDLFADTLAASSLTGHGPLLYTSTAALDEAAAAEIGRVLQPGGTVYLMGGEAALSLAVEQAVVALGVTVRRLAGPSRHTTAIAVADELLRLHGMTAFPLVLLARAGAPAENPTAAWADSMSAGGVAADRMIPILLTDTTGLNAEVDAWLRAHATNEIELLGGDAAISETVEDVVETIAARDGRSGGDTRFHTALRIRGLWPTFPDAALVGDGVSTEAWAYGLAAAGLGADLDRYLALATPDALPDVTSEEMECDDDGRRPAYWVSSPVQQAVRDALLECPVVPDD